MRSRIPAGLLDSGLTAVGTFVIGIYAVAQIGELPDDLGVYAVYMAGYLFAAAVTTQVMFIPAEKVTLALEPADRTRLAGAILRKGLPVAASMSLLVGIATIIAVATGARTELIWPFWITATLAGVATPLQDHIRRLLHLAERSWLTARVSGTQVLAAVGYLVLFHQIAPSRFWVPFAAIAASRTTSLLVGIAAVGRTDRRGETDESILTALEYRRLLVSGKYLAATGALSTGNNLVVAAIIASLAGLDALGFAEAARTVGQPILVLANGLRGVLAPRSMEAARTRNRPAARRVATIFLRLSAVLAIGYVLIAGFDWALNPLRTVASEAYVVGGLVIVTIGANLLNGIAFPARFELIGADKERSLLRAEVGANAAQLAIATAVSVAAGSSVAAGAMARPVAFAGLGASRLALYRRPLDEHYIATAGAPK